jgi:heme/copper-type cytochrome/quinol oxidase subunit 2
VRNFLALHRLIRERVYSIIFVDRLIGKLDRFIGRIALPVVIATLLIIPLAIWYYETVVIPSRYPKGDKAFTIYFDGTRNWSLNRIGGYNYWIKKHEVLKNIKVKKGDTVVFRLLSTDVYHGFALPEFGVKVKEINPGFIKEVTFVADKTGTFTFFCTRHCGPAHKNMKATLTVTE